MYLGVLSGHGVRTGDASRSYELGLQGGVLQQEVWHYFFFG